MEFDFVSDIHVDHHAKNDEIESFVKYLLPNQPSKVLIVAGDFGHNYGPIVKLFEQLKSHYDEVLFCLGNHEFYRTQQFETRQKVNMIVSNLKSMGCKHLNGTVFDINGVKFGGSHGWYDGSYTKKYHGMNDDDVYLLWRGYMNDARKIDFNIFESGKIQEEYDKLHRIRGLVDVMVSHVCPTIHNPNLPEKFKNPSTGFFSFDGDDIWFDSNIETWIFGHTHNQYCWSEFKSNGEKIIFASNPIGYPGENSRQKIQTFFTSRG